MIEFHRAALNEACRAFATCVYPGAMQPSNDIVETFAHKLEEIALGHVDFVVSLGRDPNLVTRAVDYLREAHGLPGRGIDLTWFGQMLDCLVELAVPGTSYSGDALLFLSDVREGIELAIEDAQASE
ncbi:hypothetical protein G4G28_13665 [Massilia sp. Dwa41.01b]|uniref:hypothetical protein n=1 Tax=unclassified Massilia TaxID=2609279 RepID=UPI00160124D6|nr:MULTISPECIES: hypothetical protein [unclassified Massilia]QNA89252.1 hypothetical protein G4G28_13665 [Massilia sp. Dwa41.01b]QNB00153.1 hypothetical protein G4G31_17210 [Massilia sp. Se16.2.3]